MIFFSYYTIHWSQPKRSEHWRKSVRIGYHTPKTRPVGLEPTAPNHKIMVGGLKKRGQEAALTYR